MTDTDSSNDENTSHLLDLRTFLGPPTQPVLSLLQWENLLKIIICSPNEMFLPLFSFGDSQGHLIEVLLLNRYSDPYIMKALQRIYIVSDIYHPFHCFPPYYYSKFHKIMILFGTKFNINYAKFDRQNVDYFQNLQQNPQNKKPSNPAPLFTIPPNSTLLSHNAPLLNSTLPKPDQTSFCHSDDIKLVRNTIIGHLYALENTLNLACISHPTSQSIWSLIFLIMNMISNYWYSISPGDEVFEDLLGEKMGENKGIDLSLGLLQLGEIPSNLHNKYQAGSKKNNLSQLSSKVAYWLAENRLIENFIISRPHSWENYGGKFFLQFPALRMHFFLQAAAKKFGDSSVKLRAERQETVFKNPSVDSPHDYTVHSGRVLGGEKNLSRTVLVEKVQTKSKKSDDNKNNLHADNNSNNSNNSNSNNNNNPITSPSNSPPITDQLGNVYMNPYQYPYSLSKFIFTVISHYYGHLPFSRLIFTYIRPMTTSLPINSQHAIDGVIETVDRYFQKHENELKNASTNISTKSSTYYTLLQEKLNLTSISNVLNVILDSFVHFDPNLGINFALSVCYFGLSQVPQHDQFIYPYFVDYFPHLPAEIYRPIVNSAMLNRSALWTNDAEFEPEFDSFQEDYYNEQNYNDNMTKQALNNAPMTINLTPGEKLTQVTENLLLSLQTFQRLSQFDTFLISIIQFSSDLLTYPRTFSFAHKKFQSDFSYVLTTFSEQTDRLNYLESLIVEDQVEVIDTWVEPAVDKDGVVDIWGVLSNNRHVDERLSEYEKKMSQRVAITQEEGTVRVTRATIDRFKSGMVYFNTPSCYSVVQYLVGQQDIFDIDFLYTLMTNTHPHELYIMNRPYDFGTGIDNKSIQAVGMITKTRDKTIAAKDVKMGTKIDSSDKKKANKVVEVTTSTPQIYINGDAFQTRDLQPLLYLNIGGKYLMSLLIERQYPPQILNLYLRLCEDNILNLKNNQFYPEKNQFKKKKLNLFQIDLTEKNGFDQFYNLEDSFSLTMLDYSIIYQTYRNYSTLATPSMCKSLLPTHSDGLEINLTNCGPNCQSRNNSGPNFGQTIISSSEGLDFTKTLIKRTNCAYIRTPIRSFAVDELSYFDYYPNRGSKAKVIDGKKLTKNEQQKENKNEKNEKSEKSERNADDSQHNNNQGEFDELLYNISTDITYVRPDQRYIHRLLLTINHDQDFPGELLQYLARKTIFDQHNLKNVIISNKINFLKQLQQDLDLDLDFGEKNEKIEKTINSLLEHRIASKYTKSHYNLDEDQEDIDLIHNDLITWPYIHYLLDNVPSLLKNKNSQGFIFGLIETFFFKFLIKPDPKTNKFPPQKQPQSLHDFAHYYPWDDATSTFQSNQDTSDSFVYTNKKLILNQYDVIFLIYKLISLQFSPEYLEIIFSKFFSVDYLYQLYYFYSLPSSTLSKLPGYVVYSDDELVSLYNDENNDNNNRDLIKSPPNLNSFDPKFHLGVHIESEQSNSSYAIVYKHSFFPIKHKSIPSTKLPNIGCDINQHALNETIETLDKTVLRTEGDKSDKKLIQNDQNQNPETSTTLSQSNVDYIQGCLYDDIFHTNLIRGLFADNTIFDPLSPHTQPPCQTIMSSSVHNTFPIIAYKPDFLMKTVKKEHVVDIPGQDEANIKNPDCFNSVLDHVDSIQHNISPTIVDLILNYANLQQPAYLILLLKYCHLDKMVSLNQITPSLFSFGTTYFINFLTQFTQTCSHQKRSPNRQQMYNYLDSNSIHPLVSLNGKSYIQSGQYLIENLLPLFFAQPPPTRPTQTSLQPFPSTLQTLLQIDQRDTINIMTITRTSIPSLLLFAHYHFNLPSFLSFFFLICNKNSNFNPNLPMPFHQTPSAMSNWKAAFSGHHLYALPSAGTEGKLGNEPGKNDLIPHHLNFFIQDVNPNDSFHFENDEVYPIQEVLQFNSNSGQVTDNFVPNGVEEFRKNQFPTLPVMNIIHYMCFEAIWHANVPNPKENNVENPQKSILDTNNADLLITSNNMPKFEDVDDSESDREPIHKPQHLIHDIIIPFVTRMGKKRSNEQIGKKVQKVEKNTLFLNQLVSPPQFLMPPSTYQTFAGLNYRSPMSGMTLTDSFLGPHIWSSDHIYGEDRYIRESNDLYLDAHFGKQNNTTKNIKNKKTDKICSNKKSPTDPSIEEDVNKKPLFFKSTDSLPSSNPSSTPSLPKPLQSSPFQLSPPTSDGSRFTISLHLWHVLLSGAINIPLDLIEFLMEYGLELVYKYKYFPGHIQAQAFGVYLNKRSLSGQYDLYGGSKEWYLKEFHLHSKFQKEIENKVKADSIQNDGKANDGKSTLKLPKNPNGGKRLKNTHQRDENRDKKSLTFNSQQWRCTDGETAQFESQRVLHHRLILGEIASVPVYHNFFTQAMLLGYPFVGFLVKLSQKYPIMAPNLPQFEPNYQQSQLYRQFLSQNYHNPPAQTLHITSPKAPIQAHPLVPKSLLSSITLLPKSAHSLPGFDSVFYQFRFSAHMFSSTLFFSHCNPFYHPPRLFTTPLSPSASQKKFGFHQLHGPYITPAEIPFVLGPNSHQISGNIPTHASSYYYNYHPVSSVTDETKLLYFGYDSPFTLNIATLRAWMVLYERYGLILSKKLLEAKVGDVLGVGKGKGRGGKGEVNDGVGNDTKNALLVNKVVDTLDKVNTNKSVNKCLNGIANDSKGSRSAVGISNGSKHYNVAHGSVGSYLTGTEFDDNYDDGDDDSYYYDEDYEDYDDYFDGEGEGETNQNGYWFDQIEKGE